MSLTREDVARLKKSFSDQYRLPELSAYVRGCGISRAGNNYCIQVLLCKRLPGNIKLPRRYKGVRVIYKIVGEIKPF